MDTLVDNPAFRPYAVCTAILVLKAMAATLYTGLQRQRSRGYVNEEDARVFGQGAPVRAEEAPGVAHALRIQRNDAENLPAFFAIGLVYVLSGASASGAAIYCWTYTISRIVHMVAYANHLQPWRAIAYFVGFLCLVGMSVQVLF
jgi:glutathione S-transferase